MPTLIEDDFRPPSFEDKAVNVAQDLEPVIPPLREDVFRVISSKNEGKDVIERRIDPFCMFGTAFYQFSCCNMLLENSPLATYIPKRDGTSMPEDNAYTRFMRNIDSGKSDLCSLALKVLAKNNLMSHIVGISGKDGDRLQLFLMFNILTLERKDDLYRSGDVLVEFRRTIKLRDESRVKQETKNLFKGLLSYNARRESDMKNIPAMAIPMIQTRREQIHEERLSINRKLHHDYTERKSLHELMKYYPTELKVNHVIFYGLHNDLYEKID